MIAERDAGLDMNLLGEMDNDINHLSTVDGRFHFINNAHYGIPGWTLVEIEEEDDERNTISPEEVAEHLFDEAPRWWAYQIVMTFPTFAKAYAYAEVQA